MDRPWFWSVVPTHGKHCGPGHFSSEAPVDATDSVCQRHDACYETANSRTAERICDNEACEELDTLEGDESWDPSWKERGYHRAMVNTFCGNDEFCKNTPESFTWEQQPQRQLRRREIKRSPPQPTEVKQEVRVSEPVASAPVTSAVHNHMSEVKGKKPSRRARRRARQRAAAAKPMQPKQQQKKRNNGSGKGKVPKRKRNPMTTKGRNPTRVPRYRYDPKRLDEHTLVDGCEFIKTLKIVDATANQAGKTLYALELTPLLTNTRIKQQAALWQKYRFRKLNIIFKSADSSFFSGTLIHYVDMDPLADYSSIDGTEQVISNVSAHYDEQDMKVSKNSVVRFRPSTPATGLFVDQPQSQTNADKRLTSCGKYFLFVQDPVLNALGTVSYPFTLGRVYIDYEIEFWGSALDSNAGYTNGELGIPNDMYHGVGMLGFDVVNTSIAANLLLGVSAFGIVMRALWGSDPPNLSSYSPNKGIVSTNEVYLRKDTSLTPKMGLEITGYGGEMLIYCSLIVTGTGLNTNLPVAMNVASGPGTLVTNHYTTSSLNSTTFYEAECWARLFISDPSQMVRIGWNYNPFNAISTMSAVDTKLYIVQVPSYVPPPALEGCRNKFLYKTGGMHRVMNQFTGRVCKQHDCAVCVNAQLLSQIQSGRPDLRIRDVPSDDSDSDSNESEGEEKEFVPVLTSRKKHKDNKEKF